MSNPWFRLYHEFADDPKVQSMPEHMQRRLIMLLCSRCKDETLPETLRAFHWRIGMAELQETKALFLANGFIDENWTVLNWNKRQFLSDSSTERVRNFRARQQNSALKQDETLQKQDETVTVTAPEQNRTDTEQRNTIPKASPSAWVEKIYLAYPRHKEPKKAYKAIEKVLKKNNPQDILEVVENYARHVVKNNETYVKYPATWFNAGCYLEEEWQ